MTYYVSVLFYLRPMSRGVCMDHLCRAQPVSYATWTRSVYVVWGKRILECSAAAREILECESNVRSAFSVPALVRAVEDNWREVGPGPERVVGVQARQISEGQA